MQNILLTELNFIPPKTIAILKRNGIITAYDLLCRYPNRFEDYTISSISKVEINTIVTIEGIIVSKANVLNVKTKMTLMYFYVDCSNVKIKVTIFNRHFLAPKIIPGSYVRIKGKLSDSKNFICSDITFTEFSSDINPIFGLDKIQDSKIKEYKEKILDLYEDLIVDLIPSSFRSSLNLIPLKDALRFINAPEAIEDVEKAIYRIKFEELLLYELKVKYLLYQRKNFPDGIAINYDREKVNNFIENLPFKLTKDQNDVVAEVLSDLSCNSKMNRLLQGEVGSGKTVVAAICLYAVTTASYQGAIMAPTEVLVNQHYQTFKKLFENTNIKIALLSSSLNAKEKSEIITKLENQEIDIVIGTHALFQKDVVFRSLGFVITDEEHRFGVRQRASLVEKGYSIDHLKMSATPIPRTLAISVLGDSDISTIKTMPGNRKEVITKFVDSKNTKIIFEHIKNELDSNHQIYIIASMIEESNFMDLKDATNIYHKLCKYYEGICTVGLIHSKLKTSEKEEVMEKFSLNQIQILVSTTVIEVGVNVVNATTIVILDADRFGIAQLHQMRGRVQRSDDQSYCFLVSATTTPSSLERLELVASCSDGFVLAEADLKNRGAGDFFGDKQSGTLPFVLADIDTDKELLELAFDKADEIINDIENEEYQDLIKICHANFIKNKEMLE